MKALISAPTGLNWENAKTHLSGVGLVAAGMLVAHAGLKLLNSASTIVKVGVGLGVSTAAFIGAMYLENGWGKLALLTVSAYTGLYAVAAGVAEVTAPGDKGAGGLSGFIPESVKGHIRKFLPSFGNVGDFDTMSGEDTSGFGDFNLDEPVNHGAGSPSEIVSGMGESEQLLGTTEMVL